MSLTNWLYKKSITITGATGAGADYPVLLRIGESSGASDCDVHVEAHSGSFPSDKNISGDLRFLASDDSTGLSFWVEQVVGTAPNRTAYVWVNVSDNLDTDKTIYLYYGNPSATNVSSIVDTFTFADDFNDASLDTTTKWEWVNTPPTFDEGSTNANQLTIQSTATDLWQSTRTAPVLKSQTALPTANFAIVGRINASPANNYQQGNILFYQDLKNWVRLSRAYEGGQHVSLSRSSAGISVTSAANVSATSLWLRIIKSGDTYTGAYSLDGITWTTTTSYTFSSTTLYVALSVFDVLGTSFQFAYDEVYARKYNSIEPSFSTSTAEEPNIISFVVEETLSISEGTRNVLDNESFGVEELLSIEESASTQTPISYPTDLRITGDNLLICCDGVEMTIANVDISNTSLSWSSSILNGVDDSASDPTRIYINETFELAYVSCGNGIISQFDISNLSDRTEINTGDTDNLSTVASLDDFKYIFTGTDDTDSELYMIDDTTKTSINTHLSVLKQFTKSLNTILQWIQGKILNTHFSILKENTKSIKTDLRFLRRTYEATDTLGIDNVTVLLDDVDISDKVTLNSIQIEKNEEGMFRCALTLPRYHDRLDYDVDGNLFQITNKNLVEVTFNGVSWFKGKVKRVTSSGQSESVSIEAEQQVLFEKTQVFDVGSPYILDEGATDVLDVTIDGMQTTQYSFSYSTRRVAIFDRALSTGDNVTIRYLLMDNADVLREFEETRTCELALPSLDTQRHPFDIISINDIDVFNPEIESNAANPEFYQGVKVNLGVYRHTRIWQQVGNFTLKTDSALADDFEQVTLGGPTRRYLDTLSGEWIEDDTPTYWGTSAGWTYLKDWETFKPQQGWTYFWTIKKGRVYKQQGNSFDSHLIIDKYIGTSPSSLETDIAVVDYMTFKMQRAAGEYQRNLGSYKVGSAPYKIITPQNGKYTQDRYWEDREDGLYDIIPAGSYDNIQYAKDIADLEHEKMKNISGDLLPQTSVSLDITLDAFLHYNIKLLNRINITNTTQPDIYKNNTGFPVAVKGISIDFSSLKVTLTCDNQKSRKELLALDATAPKLPEVSKGNQFRIIQKYDLNKLDYVA